MDGGTDNAALVTLALAGDEAAFSALQAVLVHALASSSQQPAFAAWQFAPVPATIPTRGTCLDRVVRLDPRDASAWVEQGRSLTRAGRREEALGCFDRAIAINPWHAPALYEKGACPLFLGHYDAAAACIDEVARLQPGPAVDAARHACQAGRDRLATPAEKSWDGQQSWPDPRSVDDGRALEGPAPPLPPGPLTGPRSRTPPRAFPPPTIWPGPAPLTIPPPPTSLPRPPSPPAGPYHGPYTGPDDDVDVRT